MPTVNAIFRFIDIYDVKISHILIGFFTTDLLPLTMGNYGNP